MSFLNSLFGKGQDNKAQAEDYFSKGAALGQAQKWPEAISALKEAVRLNPNHAKAHMSLAMCYGGTMDFDSARRHYEILKTLNPELANRLANSPAGALMLRGGPVIRM
jgi:Flp pilus assembly protein TadD